MNIPSVRHEVCDGCIGGQIRVDAVGAANASLITRAQDYKKVIFERTPITAEIITDPETRARLINEAVSQGVQQIEDIVSGGLKRVICPGKGRFGGCRAKALPLNSF